MYLFMKDFYTIYIVITIKFLFLYNCNDIVVQRKPQKNFNKSLINFSSNPCLKLSRKELLIALLF